MRVPEDRPVQESAVRHMAADPDERPFMVFWELTRACDLVCRHCRAEAQPGRHPAELSLPEALRVLDDLAPARPLLVLTGGDCFKRPDLEAIARAAVERRIPVAVSPSPTPLVTRDRLVRLYEAGVRAASLSLDGATAETYDAFRGVPGTFETALRIWAWMREIGYKVQVNTTVTRWNVRELPVIARMVLERGAMTWSVFFLVRTGRGRTLRDLSARAYEDVLHWLYDVGHWMSVKTTEGHHFKRVVLQRRACEIEGRPWRHVLPAGRLYETLARRWADLRPGPPRERILRPPMHVNSGNGILFIDHVGNVYPSGFLPIPCGNVRDTPPRTIYREHPLFRRLRRPETWRSRCGRCPFRTVCGGSRSRAYALRGSPFATDPRCLFARRPEAFPAFRPDEANGVGGQ